MRAPVIALAAVCTAATVSVIVVHYKKTDTAKPLISKPAVAYVSPSVNDTPKYAVPILQSSSPTATLKPHFSQIDLRFVKPIKIQTAVITSSSDTMIQFSEGTQIKVAADDFVNEATGLPIKGSVQLQVSEHYKMEDILSQQLSTRTEQGLLETNGMINIEAFAASGERCKLKKNGSIEIHFPKVDKPGMQLFTAVKDNSGNIIWKAAIVKNRNGYSQSTMVNVTKKDTTKLTATIIDTNLNSVAQYPGGLQGIEKNINSVKNPFPFSSQNSTMVIADFNVNEHGYVTYVQIRKSTNDAYSGALSQALYKMEGWKPAVVKGVKRTMTMRLAVAFNVSNPRLMKFWSCVKSPETLPNNNSNGWDRWYGGSSNYGGDISETDKIITDIVLTSTSLGWINCDRFYNSPAPKIDLYVSDKTDDNTSLKLVFHKIKSVLGASWVDGRYAFMNVPLGEPVTVVAIKGDKDNLLMAVKTLRIKDEKIGPLSFTKVTAEEIKETMAQFNQLPGALAKN